MVSTAFARQDAQTCNYFGALFDTGYLDTTSVMNITALPSNITYTNQTSLAYALYAPGDLVTLALNATARELWVRTSNGSTFWPNGGPGVGQGIPLKVCPSGTGYSIGFYATNAGSSMSWYAGIPTQLPVGFMYVQGVRPSRPTG